MNHGTPPDIPGAEQVVSWFGYWPSFHDAEVLHLHLNRRGVSRLSLHAWHMTDRTYESDGRQYFVLEKHAIVTFELAAISGLELFDFGTQNVLAGLHIERDGKAFHLRLDPSYGVGGRIDADQCSVSIRPGEPSTD
jgi:immunity protein 50 of polymorphic toxin system